MKAATPIATTNATTEADTAMAEVVPGVAAFVVSEGMAKVGTAKIQVVTTMQ